MNTNPDAKRILCYGDSITRGKMPEQLTRYAPHQRRTGVMQQYLGDGYEVIEEGLRGRTTHLDHPTLASRNGLETFYPVFMSHLPLDYLLIFLGTNNFQHFFLDTPQLNPILGLREYARVLQEGCEQFSFSVPEVLLIAPPGLDRALIQKSPSMSGFFSQASVESFEEKELSATYQSLAHSFGRHFCDAAAIIGSAAGDGVHLTVEQNRELGTVLADSLSAGGY